MTRCEVCGRELRNQRRFCSQKCKSIAQTREYQIVRELRRSGRVTLVQLTFMVEREFGKWNLDERIAKVIRVARETGKVEVIVQ